MMKLRHRRVSKFALAHSVEVDMELEGRQPDPKAFVEPLGSKFLFTSRDLREIPQMSGEWR